MPIKTLWAEVIDNIRLDRQDARERMREELKARNLIVVVSDVKPMTHDKYFLFKGICLRCSQQSQWKVTYRGTYYRQAVGVAAKTFVVTERGVHDHGDDAPGDVASVFQPLQQAAAVRYLKSGQKLNAKGLTNFLVEAGFPEHTLPPSAKRSRWLQNHKHKTHADSGEKVEAEARQHPREKHERPRQESMKRGLHDWPEQEPNVPAGLFLINDPPGTMTQERVCVAFAAHGMCDVMRWLADSSVVMFVDAKQSCMAHGWGVITASFAVRDQLRYTTLGRSEGRRVQARAYTSHAEPVLQAIINAKNTENISQFFETLKRLWARVVPQRPDLAKCIMQVHKDYHPALEAARKEHFPQSRPVNDFFHLLEKSKTIEARLDRSELVGKVSQKAEFGWVMASLHAFRHLPTVDLYSAIWEGWLRRLEQKGEVRLAEYLGPGGHEFYTTRVSVKTLREVYGIVAQNDDVQAELLFSPHWSGVSGISPGSDCGDQPQEAFHSPWKKQLDVLGNSADCTSVLSTMQELYRTWEKQCNWKGDKPLHLFPPAVDDNFLGGPLLARLGRSTAFELWEVRAGNHLVVDVTDTLQVVAMVRTAKETLCHEDAQAAVRMLSLGGETLQKEMVRVGILTNMKASSGVLVRRCTSLANVLRFFKNMCFVFVRPAHHPPFPTFADPLCSCTCFCRYAGCEHVEFAKMLDLRLRPATSSAEQLPVQRQRGRKRGQTLTVRGDARAKRRYISK